MKKSLSSFTPVAKMLNMILYDMSRYVFYYVVQITHLLIR